MARVLIVEDEADLAELLEYSLRNAGYEVEAYGLGAVALERVAEQAPDLILLDVMLPDVSGYEICRRLKSNANTRRVPIVMLTARGNEGDRVAGFEAGADDYVVKPFSVRELVLRLGAVLRRTSNGQVETPPLALGPLRLEPTSHRCFVEGEEVILTALEFRLLHHLISRPGRVWTRAELLHDVWQLRSELETRTIDTHVMRLREKLGRARDLLETVRGIGYRAVDVREAAARRAE